ncbi:MAG: class I SAM-dependent methyltransferase [Alphaproteobacteria bacterium]|nr:class I SAM-dependent methyltransferase [Alphaproteobacteria bacterium]
MRAATQAATPDRKRSYQGVNMVKSILAIHYLNEKHKKEGTVSGYENLIAALPQDMIAMAEYLIERMGADNRDIAEEIAKVKEYPEVYVDRLERETAFRKTELELFRRGRSKDYTGAMYENDASFERSGITSHYMGRKTYIDRCVGEAIKHGATQIVIPACGLDTVAERYARSNPHVQFILSDLPTIIDERRSLMDEGFAQKFLGGKKLGNIHYGSVDLERPEDLVALVESTEGFDPQAKTLYVFEGITMYLTPRSVQGLFQSIGQSTPNHEIVMGIILYATEAEKRLANGTYEGKTVLPLYDVYTTLPQGGTMSARKNYSISGKSPFDLQDGLVDWAAVDANYLARRPGSSLTRKKLEEARLAYQISHEHFFTFAPS